MAAGISESFFSSIAVWVMAPRVSTARENSGSDMSPHSMATSKAVRSRKSVKRGPVSAERASKERGDPTEAAKCGAGMSSTRTGFPMARSARMRWMMTADCGMSEEMAWAMTDWSTWESPKDFLASSRKKGSGEEAARRIAAVLDAGGRLLDKEARRRAQSALAAEAQASGWAIANATGVWPSMSARRGSNPKERRSGTISGKSEEKM